MPAFTGSQMGSGEFLFNVGLGMVKIMSNPQMAKNFGQLLSKQSSQQLQQIAGLGIGQPTAQPQQLPQQIAQPIQQTTPQAPVLGKPMGMGAGAGRVPQNLETLARRRAFYQPQPTQMVQGGFGSLGQLGR